MCTHKSPAAIVFASELLNPSHPDTRKSDMHANHIGQCDPIRIPTVLIRNKHPTQDISARQQNTGIISACQKSSVVLRVQSTVMTKHQHCSKPYNRNWMVEFLLKLLGQI